MNVCLHRQMLQEKMVSGKAGLFLRSVEDVLVMQHQQFTSVRLVVVMFARDRQVLLVFPKIQPSADSSVPGVVGKAQLLGVL